MQAPRLVGSLLSLAAYVRRNRIEIIHCTEKPRDAFYGVVLAKLTGARSVIHTHVSYGEWQSPMVKWALRHADAIVAVSEFSALTLVNAGFSQERVHVVHNSLDLADGRWGAHLDGRPIRREFGISDQAPVLGIVSRLFSYKGHGYLLAALPRIAQTFPDVRLLIVGTDDPRANPGGRSYRAELESEALRLGVASHLIFTGFRTDVPQLMAACDVYTMPTWEEPFGMVFLEAMALRKPVVAFALGGPAEIVKSGETGFLVEPKSVSQLAEATITLLSDPDLRERFGDEGRQRLVQVFSPHQMCEALMRVYRAVMIDYHP
jgi:glycosyltransferase involved in cell wall biosynthesis